MKWANIFDGHRNNGHCVTGTGDEFYFERGFRIVGVDDGPDIAGGETMVGEIVRKNNRIKLSNHRDTSFRVGGYENGRRVGVLQ